MKAFKHLLFLTLIAGPFLFACTGGSSEKAEKNVESEKAVEVESYNMDKQEVIKLNAPNLDRGLSVMKALNERKSVREYSDKGLSLADLSDLLWAANGINRPDEGKRTAPTAMNSQDIDVYVCTPVGSFLYDAKAHSLNLITGDNLLPAVAGGQDFVNSSPLSLVLVSDLSRFRGDNEQHKQLMGAMDAGIVSQNISLFCSAAGLVTVPRASMDFEALKKGLKLSEKQVPVMNHPVGYKK